MSQDADYTAGQRTKEAMTRLLARLAACAGMDPESGHVAADKALLKYIDDADVSAAFKALKKWYA